MSNIVIMKSIIGEEIIATSLGDGDYEKVRVFRMMPDGQGGAKAGLVPFLMTAPDAMIHLNKALIMTEINAPTDIETAYLEATTGLAIARG